MTTPTVTHAEAFEAFCRENPQVEQVLLVLALEAVRAGKRRVGLDLLWGRLRWELHVHGSETDLYRLNNNMRSYFSRKLMADHPELDGLFVVRRSDEADEWLSDYVARHHAEEYQLPSDGSLFVMPAPRGPQS